MMQRVTRTALLAAALAFVCAPAAAQDQIQGIDNIKAEVQRQIGQNQRQLFRNVELTLGDTTLYADEVEVFTDKDLIVARGNVTLAQMTNRISADSGEFNYKTKLGIFHTASGIASVKPPVQTPTPGSIAVPAALNQETDVYFAGEIIEKIGPRKYKITNGGFTTCVQPTPRWDLHAGEVILNIEHYTFLRNAVFNVKGVPLLYTPIMYYPTKKEDRSTGILLPTVGQTTLRGESIHNAFFWVLNRSQDATFMHDWFSKTGQGYGGEYRYNYGAQETGYLKAYTERQHSADYVLDDGSVQTNPGSTSYQIQGAASQMFPAHIMARGRIDYFSSLQEQQSLNMNYTNAYINTRNFGGNAVGAWGAYSMNATFDHTESFSSQTASATYGSWPKVAFSRNEKLIPGTPLYFSATGEYASLLRNQQDTSTDYELNQDVSRVDFNPQIRFPFKKWQWFTVNSTLSWRETHYSRSLEFNPTDNSFDKVVDNNLNRQFVTLSTQIVGPVFNRVFDTPNNGYAEKFKHTIEPFLNITRTSSIDNFNNIIQIDGTDTIYGGVTQFAYGVHNRFYAKRPSVAGQRSQPREIFDVDVQQTYYTTAAASQYDPRYSTSSYSSTTTTTNATNFSPILFSIRAMPTNELNATGSIEIDSRYLALRQVSAGGSYSWTNRVTTNVSWSKRAFIAQLPDFNQPANLNQSVTAQTNVHTRDNKFGGIYSFNYDVLNGRLLNQRISSFYNSQCCGVAVEYQTFNYGGITSGLGVTSDHRFFLSFTLAGLGNFSPFNGAMGGMTR